MAFAAAASRGRPGRVDQDLGWWPLAAVVLVGGLVCLIVGLIPGAARSGPVPALACGTVLVLLAVAMALFRRVPAVRDVVLWAWLAATTVMLSQASTEAEQVLVGNGFVLGGLYAATCVTGWRLAVYLAAAATGVTVGMAASAAPLLPVPWLVVVTTVVLAGTVTGRHVDTLRRVASTDALTGALNRAALTPAARALVASAHRRSKDLSVVLIDLDRFKVINDTLGHAAGDKLLVAVVEGLHGRLRGQDLVARFGGDEFVLVLPDTDTAGGTSIVEELQQYSPATWTAGIATAEPKETFESVLRRADADLYRNKQWRAAQPESSVAAARPFPDATPA